MSYSFFKGSFLSTNKMDIIHYYICEPESEIEGIVQFAHGWADCFERNQELIEYFTSYGFLVCGCDFIGHNFYEIKTDKEGNGENTFGDFRRKNAWTYLVQDTMKLNRYMKKNYKNIPMILYGHGLGSLVIRMIMAQQEPCDGVILSGTSGKQHFSRRATIFMKVFKMIKGSEYHSVFLRNRMEDYMNRHFREEKDRKAWLCSSSENRRNNNLCGDDEMFYSLGALRDMFHMLSEVSRSSWYRSVSREIPILFLSGEDDPVGNYGRGIRQVQERLRKQGCRVHTRIYAGMRHNIQDEAAHEKVFQDILFWMKSSLSTPKEI